MPVHTLFPNLVKLDHDTHTYSNAKGEQYLSVSKFLSLLSEKFEDTNAYASASEETRKQWKAKGKVAADHGTTIHNALELYNQTGQILLENAALEPVIKSIMTAYKDYHQSYDEVCLYSDEYRVAGTTDKICTLSNRKDSEVDLADFKTNLKGIITMHSDYKKRLFYPLDHLHDCNYVKYSLQLSLYAYFFEQLTGRRIRKLYIHFIPPNDMLGHYKIPVMYMKTDVKIILDHYRSQILNLVEPMQIYEF
jgi:hypothetical protein